MSTAEHSLQRAKILSLDVNVTTMNAVTSTIGSWTNKRDGRSVCVSNVHMCMEAFDDDEFRDVVNNSDLVVPDGKPLVWGLHLLGYRNAGHVRGEDLTLELCCLAEVQNLRVGLYGGTEQVLANLVRSLSERYPSLQIAYAHSPPFRPLTESETANIREEINNKEVDILFVGLGCPKQERWMAENRPFIGAVMLGVGAAFDFIAGAKRTAPRWVQTAGLEWLLRLASEPRRLWRRYCKQNPRFVWHFAGQVLRDRTR